MSGGGGFCVCVWLPEVQRKHAGWSVRHACPRHVCHSRASSGRRVLEYLGDLRALQGTVICSIQPLKKEISRWASSLPSLNSQVVDPVAASQLDANAFETGLIGVLCDLYSSKLYLHMFHNV